MIAVSSRLAWPTGVRFCLTHTCTMKAPKLYLQESEKMERGHYYVKRSEPDSKRKMLHVFPLSYVESTFYMWHASMRVVREL